MSFQLTQERRVWWPVMISVPANGGKTERRKIELQFIIDDPDAWAESDISIMDAMKSNIVDWREIEDEHKEQIPFSDDALAQLLRISYVRTAIWNTYTQEVLTGGGAKN